MRLSPGLSELRRLAGRAPLPAPAGLPPLRLRDAAAGARARNARRRTRSWPSVPASSGWSRRRRSCFRAAASWCCPATSSNRSSACARSWTTSPQGRFDIVIGTQLVAKGHHFPKLNLVGVVDADLGLSNGDPRAAERTFQLLHQVAGRAGREEGRAIGYLQTHQPEHPVMRALIGGRPRGVLRERDRARARRLSYPPFGRLASLHRVGAERPSAEGFARRLAAVAPRDERGARARPGRSAARRRARPPPLSAAGEIAARLRPLRPICATGSPPRPSARATSSSKSTSTRRAFL